MNTSCTSYGASMRVAECLRASGWNDVDVENKAMELYRLDHKNTSFKFMHVYNEVKDEARWTNAWTPEEGEG